MYPSSILQLFSSESKPIDITVTEIETKSTFGQRNCHPATRSQHDTWRGCQEAHEKESRRLGLHVWEEGNDDAEQRGHDNDIEFRKRVCRAWEHRLAASLYSWRSNAQEHFLTNSLLANTPENDAPHLLQLCSPDSRDTANFSVTITEDVLAAIQDEPGFVTRSRIEKWVASKEAHEKEARILADRVWGPEDDQELTEDDQEITEDDVDANAGTEEFEISWNQGVYHLWEHRVIAGGYGLKVARQSLLWAKQKKAF